ncbi:myelin expression factor 2-like protein [Dinothrombium tinctorium]|uniref:Myelin expression factor 2-like protein n=1 Tax=Dinothrombium tinctorium TaxID=1965070 RepID=A0A3S4R7Q1_9ACAR|nr:myelin expression factor 2-like protein [Dinothrombium tinctorium]
MDSTFDDNVKGHNGREESGSNTKARDRGESRSSRRGRSRSPVERSSRSSRGDSRASRRVYVANVPFDVKWSDLKDLFRDKIGNVSYCQLFEDENGRSRGCGLVEFQDSASAKKAIEILHRYNYRNRELVVKEDLDCERDRYGRLILPSSKSSREKERDRERDLYDNRSNYNQMQNEQHLTSWNTYGLSPQFLESLGVSGPLNNRVFVANLDYKVGEKKLEEIFRLAGKVLRVRLYTDANGTSKGHGTVEFEHPVEAVQAISMFHNQKLYGRPMSIRMDKYECEEMPEVLPSKLPSGLEGIGKGLGIGGQPLNIGKSLLNTSLAPVPQVAPVQPPQQAPVPTANSALTALGSLAGSLTQIPSLAQTAGLNQIATSAPPAVSAASALGAPSLNIQGFDRSLGNLGGAASSLAAAGLGSGGVGVGLSSLANTAQNVLAAAASLTGSSSLAGVSSALGLTNQVPASNNTNLSVYSTYEREFRDDKYRNPPPMSDTVVVRNLPANFSWQNIRDRFNEIGEIRYAELKSRGTAVIRFISERDAQRAVDLMNGMRLDNQSSRPIEVSLYL